MRVLIFLSICFLLFFLLWLRPLFFSDPTSQSFDYAVFDKEFLSKLLKDHPTCYGLRFYNVIPAVDEPGTVIVACYDKDGCDMDLSPTDELDYYRADGLNEADAIETPFNHTEASRQCDLVDAAKLKKFSVKFRKKYINQYLSGDKCNGILLQNQMYGRDNSMTMSAIEISGGHYSLLGRSRISQEPCPTACPRVSRPMCVLHEGN